MYLLIIFLPLLSSIITGFGGRWLGFYGCSVFSVFSLIITLFFSLLAFFEIGFGNSNLFCTIFTWIDVGFVNLTWSFLFDSLTVTMLLVINFISTLVHFYSIDYMSTDPHFPRFISFLGIFTFFMLILVTSDNLLQMFLGWEGVGLASYLLINFWFTRLAANKSALKALIINRIGDFGLLFAIFAIFAIFKSLNYLTIFSIIPFLNLHYLNFIYFKIHTLTFIGFFIIIGAIGKSAQLGLHTWLPDAMEGPTPVSALIHAATMVTAGVFLIIRFSPLFEFSLLNLIFLILLGSLTAFFAAMTGTFQHDLKKVIAYSTCSQLGYMIFCCGLSNYNVSIFHLTNHAFFKALLFLSAGSVIHSVSNEQDMRKMGSLVNFLPITYSLMLIGSLALTGFPFLTGFYSKDSILEITNIFRNSNLPNSIGVVSCWLGNFSAFLTSLYSTRLIFLTFFNNASYSRKTSFIRESSWIILLPLVLLATFSIFFGYYLKEFFIGIGTDSWNNSIFYYPSNLYFLESEFLYCFIKWCPFILSITGFCLAVFFNFNSLPKLDLTWFFYLINKKWFFDIFYNKLVVFPVLNFGYKIAFKNLDRGFIEILGPYGFVHIIPKLSTKITTFQTGYIIHYIFFIVFSLCILLIFEINFFQLKLFNILFYFILFYFI